MHVHVRACVYVVLLVLYSQLQITLQVGAPKPNITGLSHYNKSWLVLNLFNFINVYIIYILLGVRPQFYLVYMFRSWYYSWSDHDHPKLIRIYIRSLYKLRCKFVRDLSNIFPQKDDFSANRIKIPLKIRSLIIFKNLGLQNLENNFSPL